MREHTFRAQKKDTREWVYGNLVVQPNSTFIIPKTEKDQQPDFIEVDPKTVGMSTTINDSSNPSKEIYEDDVVEYEAYLPYSEYKKTIRKIIRWERKDIGGYGLRQVVGFYNLDSSMKVIGNIHDNPDLLKR